MANPVITRVTEGNVKKVADNFRYKLFKRRHVVV